MLRLISVLASVALVPAWASQLQTPTRTENFTRDLGNQPLPRYEAGHVCSKDASHTSFWVDYADDAKGTAVEKALTFSESFRPSINDVAVSFDGDVAVSASVMDREGRFSAVIAWLRADGSLIRVVRTSPFAASDIGFTADGSLWAIGIVKNSIREEEKVHDVMRQYGSDGVLVRSLLPRLSISTDRVHPIMGASLSTSGNYAALVSPAAKKWALISSDGIIVAEGSLVIPPRFTIITGGVTDSGRLFVSGQWPEGKEAASGKYPLSTLFEIDRGSSEMNLVNTGEIFPEGTFGRLIGSQGEELVFHLRSVSQPHRLIWSTVD